MKFLDLEIQNFMSIEHTKTHLNDRGLVLIQGNNTDSTAFGSNGAGKSSIFSESIVWALFGETIRGYKGDDVIHRDKKKDAYVHLSILDDNGDVYRVERYRKHKEHKNSVLLMKNGENITGKSDTETTKMIENFLQIDFLSFTNSVMFGQGMTKKFANSTDAEQKKILERILQIDIFKKCQDIAKSKVSELNNLMSRVNQEITTNSRQIDSQKEHLEDLQEKEAQLGDAVRERIQELQEQLQQYDAELEEFPDRITELEDKTLILETNKFHLMKRYHEYDTVFNQKVEKTVEMKSLVSKLDKLNKEINKDIDKMEGIIKGQNIPKICNSCGQEIPKGDTTHIVKHLQQGILEKDGQALVIEDEIKVLRQEIDELCEQLDGRDRLDRQIEKLDREIQQSIKDTTSAEGVFESTKKLANNVQKQIEREKKSLEKTYTDLIEKAIESISDLEGEGQKLTEQKGSIQSDIDLHSFWVEGFGNKGIKSKLLDDVVPFLNTRANHYLGRLTDNSIEVEFNTQQQLKSGEYRDKFSVDVNNVNGGNKYQGNSGGECRRIDVAVNMALQDLVHSRSNKKVDLIVYDEAWDALDKAGCEIAIELLEEKAKSCGSVIVITHNSDLAELFTETITVTKKNGKTVISER